MSQNQLRHNVTKLFLHLTPIFLITLFPLLDFYSHNVNLLLFGEILFLSAPFILLAIGSTIFFTLVFKNFPKGALFTIYLLLFFYFFHHNLEIFNAFTKAKYGIVFFRLRYILAFFILFSSFLFYKILKTKKISPFFFSAIIIIFGILNLFALQKVITEVRFDQKLTRLAKNQNNRFYNQFLKEHEPSQKISQNLPDIYLIILDMYIAPKFLKKYWNCNVDNFIQKLRNYGFYIARDSRCNYPSTSSSISSSLNAYFHKNGQPSNMKVKITEQNNVMRFLKSHGYTIKNIRSNSLVTRFVNYPKPQNILEYMKKSWLGISQTFGLYKIFLAAKTFLFYQSPITKIFQQYTENKHKEIILNQIKELKESIKIPGPKFVFCHILCPHGPYVFAEKNHLSNQSFDPLLEAVENDFEKIALPQQIKVINKHILGVLKEVLEKSGLNPPAKGITFHGNKKPIILLQADHGHPHYGFVQKGKPESIFPYHFIGETFGILNAWHLPNKDYDQLNQNITPVNNFRIIFDKYFGANLGMLPENSFFQISKNGRMFFSDAKNLLNIPNKDFVYPKELDGLFVDNSTPDPYNLIFNSPDLT